MRYFWQPFFMILERSPAPRLEDGQWTSPNHGRVGSRMVREFLWREWEMAGEADLQALRECVLPADPVPYGSRPYSETEGRGKNIDPDQRLGGGGAGLFP